MAELLLANGADPNIEDIGDWTPLKLAISRNDERMARLLREHGAME